MMGKGFWMYTGCVRVIENYKPRLIAYFGDRDRSFRLNVTDDSAIRHSLFVIRMRRWIVDWPRAGRPRSGHVVWVRWKCRREVSALEVNHDRTVSHQRAWSA
jgi:hypothetical protein